MFHLLLGHVQFPARRPVEERLVVRQAEQSGRTPSRHQRKAAGISNPRPGVQIGQKTRTGDSRLALRHLVAQTRQRQVAVRLRRQGYGLFQSQWPPSRAFLRVRHAARTQCRQHHSCSR